jgi:hypothetical protein
MTLLEKFNFLVTLNFYVTGCVTTNKITNENQFYIKFKLCTYKGQIVLVVIFRCISNHFISTANLKNSVYSTFK